MRTFAFKLSFLILILTAGCQTMKPIETVDYVDLKRFMGKWYVIANIPTFIEKDAFNAVEYYRMDKDGTIATTFKFNKGSLDGPLKEYNPRGFIRDSQSNAVWAMPFFWPFKAEYRIIYLAEDYLTTVIGRTKRDYVWVMAREPSLPDEKYASIMEFLQEQGYDVSQIQKILHQGTESVSKFF